MNQMIINDANNTCSNIDDSNTLQNLQVIIKRLLVHVCSHTIKRTEENTHAQQSSDTNCTRI